jgi:hypothetical protein
MDIDICLTIAPRFGGLEFLYVHNVSRHFGDAELVGVVLLKLPNMVSYAYQFLLIHFVI